MNIQALSSRARGGAEGLENGGKRGEKEGGQRGKNVLVRRRQYV